MFRARTIAALLVLTMVIVHPSDAADQPSRAVAERFGLTPAQTRQLNARNDGLSGEVIELSRINKVQARTLGAIALELGSRSPNLSKQQFIELIRARAADAGKAQAKIKELEQTLLALDPVGERTQALKLLETAQAAFDEGRLADAEAAFGALSFLRSSELGQARKAWMEAIDLQAQSAFVRGDMEAMDRILSGRSAELARQQQAVLRDQWTTQAQRANYWYDYGDRLGDNEALRRSIGVYRDAVLPLVPRQQSPHDWAMSQMNLAGALWKLGERESGTERLRAAMIAYGLALAEISREKFPLDWALTQSNLAVVMQTLGSRENDTALLELAVVTHRLALEEQKREIVPLDWARTQTGLAIALWKLGEREQGTTRLEQAAAANRLALEEYRRDSYPRDWARTQLNSAIVLLELGDREHGVASLVEAVASFRSALDELQREQVPLEWARAQVGLANGLQALDRRQGGKVRLNEAVIAYRLALEELRRDRVPLDWAMTQTNLANALMTLDERNGETELFDQAVAAYRLALEELRRERVPLAWANTQRNLAIALQSLGEREVGTKQLELAVEAYTLALGELRRERDPIDWAGTMLGKCRAELLIAKRRGENARLPSIRNNAIEARSVALSGGHAGLVGFADSLLAGMGN